MSLYYNTTTNQLVSAVKTDAGYELKRESVPADPHSSIEVSKAGNLLTERQVIVVDSSKSGVGRLNRDIYTPILKPIFEELGVQHKYVLTEAYETIQTIGSELELGAYTIILISGDTSVNEFINGLNTTNTGEKGDICIFNIPFGTGNSLALSLGFLDELDAISKLIVSDKPVQPLNLYDLTLPQDTWLLQQDKKIKLLPHTIKFVIVFSWGFHAALVADSDTPEYRQFGIDRFKMAAGKNLEKLQQYNGKTVISPHPDVHTIVDPENLNGPFAYWLVTPSKKFEPTFEILPHGNLYDDNLYLVAFNTDEGNSNYIMEIMMKVYNKGDHINDNRVCYKKVSADKSITLSFQDLPADKRRFCMDGSILLVPESGEISIQSYGNRLGNWSLYIPQ